MKANVFTDSALGYYSAVFSPDRMYVVAGDYRGIVKIWQAHSGRLVRKVKAAYGLGKRYGVYAGWEGFGEWELGYDLEVLGRRLFVHSPITDDE